VKQKEIVFNLLVIGCAKDRVSSRVERLFTRVFLLGCHNAGRESSDGEPHR
jgi:hypothetical protein